MEDASRAKIRAALDTLGDAMDERPLPKDKVKSALDALDAAYVPVSRDFEVSTDSKTQAIATEARDEMLRAETALKNGGRRRRRTKKSKRGGRSRGTRRR